MSAITGELQRFWEEARGAIGPDLLLGGIYANKAGYHNTREAHLQRRPGDYSIQVAADREGPGDRAAAIDLTFDTARHGNYDNIAKYSKRLYNAMRDRDPRLFHNGRGVPREFFGNIDADAQVEGWSLYRGRAASSDPSHAWHIHISFHRAFVSNWTALSGVLDVLLDRTRGDDDMPLTEADAKLVAKYVAPAVWSHRLDPGPYAERIAGYTPGATYPAGGLLVGADAYGRELHSTLPTILAGIAKLAEPGLSDAERAQLAADIAEQVNQWRVVLERTDVAIASGAAVASAEVEE